MLPLLLVATVSILPLTSVGASSYNSNNSPSTASIPSASSLSSSSSSSSSMQQHSTSSLSYHSSTATQESTCPFRTANYITHGLPQQCLRKSWATPVPDTSQDSDGTDRAHVAQTTSIDLNDPRALAEAYTFSLVSATTGSAMGGDGTVSVIDTATDFEASASPLSEDAESPLDNTKFLSFEEWKAQNLAKAGQSAENFGQRAVREPRKRPGSGNGDLDSLGEDAEIELDMFNPDGAEETDTVANNVAVGEKPSEPVSPHGHTRSKDAGKTCKERFNFASFDCAATVHKTNPECKGATSILVENKDSYMLNKCNAKNKFVIVELCDDILVDTVVLANYEFFSSMFRTFRVSVSDKYPVKAAGWKELGLYEAKNSREIQAFLVENPLIWARYLRIEFLSHYGNEFYCPLSLLRVHGTTMMEEFRHQEELARGEVDESEEMEPEAVAPEIEIASASDRDGSQEAGGFASPTKSWVRVGPSSASSVTTELPAPSIFVCDVLDMPQLFSSKMAHEIMCPAIHTPTPSSSSTIESSDIKCSVQERSERTSKTLSHPVTVTSIESVRGTPSVAAKSDAQKENGSASKSQHVRNGAQSSVHKGTQARPSDATEHKAQAPSATSAPPASPTTQESFYKTIHKRLQLLEANATLSLQYIEEQSRLLRDAFSKMEKRQLSKTSAFIDQLNSTVLNQLIGFRQQYDQLWQSTVIALESQKESSEREIVAISQRLSILADEVIYQKRMSIIQSILLLVTIVLIIFSKTNTFDTPILQTMVSSRSFPRFPLESPPTSPPPPLIRKYMQDAHSRNTSDDYDVGMDRVQGHPNQYHYSPPSSPPEYLAPDGIKDEPQVIRSSPATPSGRNTRKVAWTAEFGSPLKDENLQRVSTDGVGVPTEWVDGEEEEEGDEEAIAQNSGLMTPMSDTMSSLRRTVSDITPTIVYQGPDEMDDSDDEFLDTT